MLKPKSVFWSIAILLAFSSCKKKEEPKPALLPAETQTGKMIAACRVNNQNWVVDESKVFPNKPFIVTYDSNKKSLFLLVYNKQDGKTDILEITINGFEATGEYPLFVPNTTNDKPHSAGTFVSNYQCTQYRFKQGKVRITKLDKTNKIISGKFEFTSPEMTGEACKEVKITEGFFDVKY